MNIQKYRHLKPYSTYRVVIVTFKIRFPRILFFQSPVNNSNLSFQCVFHGYIIHLIILIISLIILAKKFNKMLNKSSLGRHLLKEIFNPLPLRFRFLKKKSINK